MNQRTISFLSQREAAARDHARSFIVFQVVFWGAFLAMRTYASAQAKPEYLYAFMPNRILLVCVGALLTTAIHLALAKLPDRVQPFRFWITSLLCALSLIPMRALEVHQAATIGVDLSHVTFLDYALQFGWALLMWAGYYIALEHASDVRMKAIALAEAQERQHDAEIKMLRYQLNPHFLFNSLNAVSSLVLDGKNAEADSMLIRLANFLRTMIDSDPLHMNPLSAEFAMQRLYMDIEAARFGDRLRARFDLPDALADCVIPSMLLQPIVENAVKHAISRRTSVGEIAICAAATDGVLRLTVQDDGPGSTEHSVSNRRGIGIVNTRERLQRIYGDAARLCMEPRAQGGMLVRIDLPIQRVSSLS